jgi:hypothetical protein
MATRSPSEIQAILLDPGSGLLDRIARNLGDFTVALLALSGSPQTIKLVGTGTLLVVGEKYFILTALHVWEEALKFADYIGITMKAGINHRTVIDRLTVVPTGLPKPEAWNEWGPDLVLLSVPAEDLGRIKAYKSFWSSDRLVEVHAEVCEAQVLMGTPAALGTLTDTHADLVMNGMLVGPNKVRERGDLDYADYLLALTSTAPRNFGGVSGGGLWRVYLYWEPSREEIDWKMSLHGVAYWQFPIVAERTVIRCHGPQSIRAALRQLTV